MDEGEGEGVGALIWVFLGRLFGWFPATGIFRFRVRIWALGSHRALRSGMCIARRVGIGLLKARLVDTWICKCISRAVK